MKIFAKFRFHFRPKNYFRRKLRFSMMFLGVDFDFRQKHQKINFSPQKNVTTFPTIFSSKFRPVSPLVFTWQFNSLFLRNWTLDHITALSLAAHFCITLKKNLDKKKSKLNTKKLNKKFIDFFYIFFFNFFCVSLLARRKKYVTFFLSILLFRRAKRKMVKNELQPISGADFAPRDRKWAPKIVRIIVFFL